VRPLAAQIDETIELCRRRIEIGEKILITTLTKKTAEDLADYLREIGLRVRYLHSDIDTIERVEILRTLRSGDCDILVGINLLREGLDLPEVSLVCILDADKEGYLRSRTSLIQTSGRAARHLNGEVVLFADRITGSMQDLLDISAYRRKRQEAHNKQYGITPRSVVRAAQESLHVIVKGREVEQGILREDSANFDAGELIRELERDMADASSRLEYERAALLRDQITELKNGTAITGTPPIRKKGTYAKASRKKKG
jgi:excinuclease ABC subunit B